MSKRNAALLFILLIFVWGINWSVIKLILVEVPPLWTAALRTVIAAIVLFFIQIGAQQFIIPQRQDVHIIWIIGIIQIVGTCTFMSLGLQFVEAGRSSVLGYTTPLWVVPGAWFFLKESIPPRRIIGALLGLAGLVVLCNPYTLDWSNTAVLWGHLFLLASAFCWAIAIIAICKHKWLATPFQLIFWQTLLAALVLVIMAAIFEGVPSFNLSGKVILFLLYAGVFATAGGFWAMTEINRILPASIVALSSLATPVTGMVFAVILLGERIDLALGIASALILGGIGLGITGRHSKKSV